MFLVIRPEDVELVAPAQGTLTGEVTHLIFKGVHYEMEVMAGGFEWLVHSTALHPVGEKVGIRVDPSSLSSIMVAGMILLSPIKSATKAFSGSL